MLFAHLKRILNWINCGARSQRHQRRAPPRRYTQNLRKMAKLIPMLTHMAPA
jgi:hypothetical protein